VLFEVQKLVYFHGQPFFFFFQKWSIFTSDLLFLNFKNWSIFRGDFFLSKNDLFSWATSHFQKLVYFHRQPTLSEFQKPVCLHGQPTPPFLQQILVFGCSY